MPYFTHSAVAVTVLITLCVATATSEATGLFRTRSGASKRDRGSALVLSGLLVPAVLLLAFSPGFAPGAEIHPEEVSLVVGLLVLASGEGLRIWARITLGHYFTYGVQTSVDQPVIRGGPYRFVRHPSYTGILLILTGFSLVWGNWAGLAIAVTFTAIGLGFRIKVEEDALLAELGEPYREFCATRRRLLPLIW